MTDLNTIVSLAKRRGFVFQSSEIYGGLASTYDYGPLGVEMRRNIKDHWWRTFVHKRADMVGLDAAILMAPQVWDASGHTSAGFADSLVECKACHQRFRSDHILAWRVFCVRGDEKEFLGIVSEINPNYQAMSPEAEQKETALLIRHGCRSFESRHERMSREELKSSTDVPCPYCDAKASLSDPRMFNLMLKTFLGPVEDSASQTYLRPETAQGIFVNFLNVLNSTRKKLPFGIAQIGKAFRNEITVGNFIFRTREFEQMEIEYFVKPGSDAAWLDQWVKDCLNWFTSMGIPRSNLDPRQHDPNELAHYAKATYDIEYKFPWGWGEIQGIASRTDYDLKAHSQASGVDLTYFDGDAQQHYHPYVIEPSAGVDRIFLTLLFDAYKEEEAPTGGGKMEKRVLLKLHPIIAPVKVAVLPLSRNEKLVPKAREVFDMVNDRFVTQYDDSQSIGRRYRRQDEIGTPLCVTVDFQTVEEDDAVTIRDRDTMEQVRIPIPDLLPTLTKRLPIP